MDFSAYNTWGFFSIFATILISLLIANALKKLIKPLEASLVPTSVLGGTILLIIAVIYKNVTGDILFDTKLFGSNGVVYLEMITYHALALGFISASLKSSKKKMTKKRGEEVFNTGITTVNTYILQAIVGLAVTIPASFIIKDFLAASGIILAFGYGQGTGQAMNYGSIYELENGFVGGKAFGLTVAAIGFLCASFGGVIHLNILKRTGKLKYSDHKTEHIDMDDIQAENEIPMQESVDKLSIQLALITLSYMIAYGIMFGLSQLLPGMKSTIYGFNFLLGVLTATLVKATINFLMKKNIVKKKYTNNFLLTRTSNFFFDIMVVAGIAAINLDMLERFWGVIAIVCSLGMIITYVYNRVVAKTLFKDYSEEQFLAMYGMLTGTASTGIILLREVDIDFKTPVADNLVYQNFPAIVFGLPIMLLANIAPNNEYLVFGILFAMAIILNILLFRRKIFKKFFASRPLEAGAEESSEINEEAKV